MHFVGRSEAFGLGANIDDQRIAGFAYDLTFGDISTMKLFECLPLGFEEFSHGEFCGGGFFSQVFDLAGAAAGRISSARSLRE